MSFYYMHDLIYALVLLVLFQLNIKKLFACLVYQKALAMFDLFLVSRDLAILCFIPSLCLFYPFVDEWQKGGEEFVVYMHGWFMHMLLFCFSIVLLISKVCFIMCLRTFIYYVFKNIHLLCVW